MIYVNNPEIRGFFRLDKSGREGFLVVFTAGERGTEESRFPADNITGERAGELLRAAIGADVDFEITLVAKWLAVCDNAQSYSKGRVLIAGDAAHTGMWNCSILEQSRVLISYYSNASRWLRW